MKKSLCDRLAKVAEMLLIAEDSIAQDKVILSYNFLYGILGEKFKNTTDAQKDLLAKARADLNQSMKAYYESAKLIEKTAAELPDYSFMARDKAKIDQYYHALADMLKLQVKEAKTTRDSILLQRAEKDLLASWKSFTETKLEIIKPLDYKPTPDISKPKAVPTQDISKRKAVYVHDPLMLKNHEEEAAERIKSLGEQDAAESLKSYSDKLREFTDKHDFNADDQASMINLLKRKSK